MSQKLFWTKFVHHEHEAATKLLNRDELGGYYCIYNACFAKGGFVPDDDRILAKITMASAKEWKRLRPALASLFTIDERGWSHETLLEDMEKGAKIVAERREAGKKGGEDKALKGNKTAGKTEEKVVAIASGLPYQNRTEHNREKTPIGFSPEESKKEESTLPDVPPSVADGVAPEASLDQPPEDSSFSPPYPPHEAADTADAIVTMAEEREKSALRSKYAREVESRLVRDGNRFRMGPPILSGDAHSQTESAIQCNSSFKQKINGARAAN